MKFDAWEIKQKSKKKIQHLTSKTKFSSIFVFYEWKRTTTFGDVFDVGIAFDSHTVIVLIAHCFVIFAYTHFCVALFAFRNIALERINDRKLQVTN